ncbi:MAG TPA: hypothetical protein VF749_18545 [Candidatus Acidoferrum sp.]
MPILSAARVCFLGVFLVVGIKGYGIPLPGQSSQSGEQIIPSERLGPERPSSSGEQIFADLMRHNEIRNAGLREYSALRTYAVTDTNGKVRAKETVRMDYVAPDRKTFVTIAEEGSSLVRHLVLNRLMETEASAAVGQDHRDSSISPANYVFRLLGEEDLGPHHCFVVEALPQRRDKYLFEGKIWIESQDFAVVRISGHPAKSPSFWIKRADFVRQYEKIGDFWLPAMDQTFVDVRLYGKKILSIEHHVDRVNGVTPAAVVVQPAPASSLSASMP